MHLMNVPLDRAATPAKIRKLNSAGRAAIGDIRMYYEVQGQGEPLLLIMGLEATLLIGDGSCLKNWQIGIK